MTKAVRSFPVPESWWPHLVSYGETDAMAVVYYANYLHWFEQSRSHFIRERGMSYNEVERRGVYLPVREAACRYLRPARYDDEIFVRVGISVWGRASVEFVYEVRTGGDRSVLHTTGRTQHACVDATGKPVAIPAWLKELFSV